MTSPKTDWKVSISWLIRWNLRLWIDMTSGQGSWINLTKLERFSVRMAKPLRI